MLSYDHDCLTTAQDCHGEPRTFFCVLVNDAELQGLGEIAQKGRASTIRARTQMGLWVCMSITMEVTRTLKL